MAVLFARIALSCGIDWSEPRCKIEGCNEQGYVLITEKLSDLSIPGENEAIPLWAIFDSSRRTASPYIGMGWSIPFLECNLVQLSEDEFLLTEPSGWKRLFRRAGKGSNILAGGGGWKGQLSLDHATLWADCGWKIELFKGKIVQMKTPHGQTIFYNYTNGRIASVTCGLRTLVSVDAKERPDHIFNMVIGEKRYSIALASQPQVQCIGGANVIGSNDPSFNRLSGPDCQTRTFAYSVDNKVRPVLTITDAANKETLVCWDPETRRIIRYGEWNYTIGPSYKLNPVDKLYEDISLARTNDSNQTESWSYDPAKGAETILSIDGVQRVTTRFTSGILNGAIRNELTLRPNQQQLNKTISSDVRTENSSVRNYSYDENGNIIAVSIVKPSAEAEKPQDLTIRSSQTDAGIDVHYSNSSGNHSYTIPGTWKILGFTESL